MGILISIVALWTLWKLFKFSFWLLGVLLMVALGIFLVKALLLPGILLILGLLGWGLYTQG